MMITETVPQPKTAHYRVTPIRQKVDPPDLHPARLLFTTLVLSSVWALLKFIVSWETDSLAVLSDAIFSLIAILANVSGLLMLWLESRKGSSQDLRFSRAFQMRIILVHAALFSLIIWEIFHFIFARYYHPFFTYFRILPAMIGIGSAIVAQFSWWLLARQGPQQRALVLSRKVGWMQNFTSILALLALPDLAHHRPALDLMAATLILVMASFSIYRMINSSLDALTEA